MTIKHAVGRDSELILATWGSSTCTLRTVVGLYWQIQANRELLLNHIPLFVCYTRA